MSDLINNLGGKLKDKSVELGRNVATSKAGEVLRSNSVSRAALNTYIKVKNLIKNSKRAYAVASFLVSNPVGWAISAVAIIGIGAFVYYANDSLTPVLDYTQGGVLSDQETAVIAAGCDVQVEAATLSSAGVGETVDPGDNPFLQKIGGKRERATRLITALKSDGFSGGQIAVLLAVGARESGLDPAAVNQSGGVRGIFQWSDKSVTGTAINGDRMAWLRDQNLELDSLDNQLKLMRHELSGAYNGYYRDEIIPVFLNHQTTSDADLMAVLDVWETRFEGLAKGDGQRKEEEVWRYIKGVLEAFPELNSLQQSANFAQTFNYDPNGSGPAEDNRSNSVAQSLADRCGLPNQSIGGDELAQSMIRAAFQYYGANVAYSMDVDKRGILTRNRNGEVTGGFLDCSSFVFQVLNDIGVEGIPKIGSTETLFSLEGKVLLEISRDEVTTGDIFVTGTPGMSAGSDGHTGIFLNKNWIIHSTAMTWENNGGGGEVYVNDYPSNNFGMEARFYRVMDRTVSDKARDLKTPSNFIDMATDEALAKAIKDGKIKDPRHIKAGQSEKDLAVNSGSGGVSTKPDFSIPNTYPVGECTWGVQTMARWVGHNWGNAKDWDDVARSKGFKTGKTPKPGSIAVWQSGGGGYGHVAYVIGVRSNSEIQVMESNYIDREIRNQRGWFNPTTTSEGEVVYIYPK